MTLTSSSPVRIRRRAAAASVGTLAVLALAFAASAQAAAVPVPLGTAESFAVLAGTGVTNTGPTTITGDLGTYPTPAITGAGTITLTGSTHAADAVAQQAQTDLVTAYDAAAGQGPVQAVPVELGGLVLTSGVYSSGGELGLTGTLTLDAGGDPNAVFVLQSPSTLITATDSVVALTNGAQACNVYWQVTSSATLGVRTSFVGTVMALTTISLQNQATVDGRLLARNGAVTLDSNTITRPECAPVPTPTTTPTATQSPTAAPQVTQVPSGGVATGDGSSLTGPTGGLPVVPLALLGAAALVVGAARLHARRTPAAR